MYERDRENRGKSQIVCANIEYENLEEISLDVINTFSEMKLDHGGIDDIIIIPSIAFDDKIFRMVILSQSSMMYVIRGDNGKQEKIAVSRGVNIFGLAYSPISTCVYFPYRVGRIVSFSFPDFKKSWEFNLISHENPGLASIYQIIELDESNIVISGCDRTWLHDKTLGENVIEHEGHFMCFLRHKKGEGVEIEHRFSHKTAAWSVVRLKTEEDCIISAGGSDLETKEDHYIRKWNWRNQIVEKKFPTNIHLDRIVTVTSYCHLGIEYIISGSRDDRMVRWSIDGDILNILSTRTTLRLEGYDIDSSKTRNEGIYSLLHYRKNIVIIGGGNGGLNFYNFDNPPSLFSENEDKYHEENNDDVFHPDKEREIMKKEGYYRENPFRKNRVTESKIFAIRWVDETKRNQFVTNHGDSIAPYRIYDGVHQIEDFDEPERIRFLCFSESLCWEVLNLRIRQDFYCNSKMYIPRLFLSSL